MAERNGWMNYKIENGYLLLYTEGGFRAEKQDFYIEGSKITKIGSLDTEKDREYQKIDAADQLII